jgi:adenine-specific DNA methylase
VSIVPFAWRDRPSLIERLLPAQKLSAEAQKERKAGIGQTLTALGSYWKGRKPLILVKACVLGSLLPATDNPEGDLRIFEALMAIDDEAFLRREFRPSCFDLVKRLHDRGAMSAQQAESLFEVRCRRRVEGRMVWQIEPFHIEDLDSYSRTWLQWHDSVGLLHRHQWELAWVRTFTYIERVSAAKRPEELEGQYLFEPIWNEVNTYLGTQAESFPQLVEQLGILRFGTRPRIGDTFCGGGSIPFEAARLGCDVYASDLNPIACMLTWGALNIIGAAEPERKQMELDQYAIAAAVDREVSDLGIEHDSDGNRAKSYLYCLEIRCPQTKWMVPLAPSWVISRTRNVIARLIPDHDRCRFDIEVVTGVSNEELEASSQGTLRDGEVIYSLNGETYRTKYSTIRGDIRHPDGRMENKLRRWSKADFMPHSEDILQERLYCIQWIRRETMHSGRQVTFFAAVTADDIERERAVEDLVKKNIAVWQSEGLVPDMPIEPGDETTRLLRERGWAFWHQLFNPRQLNCLRIFRAHSRNSPGGVIGFAKIADYSSRLCRWDAGHQGSSPQAVATFTNQALNTVFNYGCKSAYHLGVVFKDAIGSSEKVQGSQIIVTLPASEADGSPLVITDPPYADAIQYHEITEFFIAWLRKTPPPPFDQWVWDSRRPLAIKGAGEEFRREMVIAYGGISRHMPDNGLQIIMFTHQDAGVWADLAAIVWGAGLQVTAAWYIATETTSELKKGGYVQGTVLLVLRKRLQHESAYKDELVQEVRAEVANQIETMTGLNQAAKGAGRSENLFEDQDLQMAGYAAALRVLTGYSRIDGQDMAAEALRPRPTDGTDLVKEIIDFAVQVANEHLVPEGIAARLWERLTGPERFYLRMLDIETGGAKKLDNYQNFAKAFRYGDYAATMGSMKANDARLKTALEFKRSEFEGDFGKSALRAILFALYELQRDVDIDEAISHLRDLVPGYLSRREDLMALATVIAAKRETKVPAEAQAARILFSRIKNERLG